MNKFYILKETGTFSDSIECLGLASIINGVFQKTDNLDIPEILIEDKGYYFQLTLDRELTNEIIDNCEYFDFIPYVAKKSNDENLVKYSGLNYEYEYEIKEKFKNLKDKKKSEFSPEPRFDLIKMFASMYQKPKQIGGYNKSFLNEREWEKDNNFSQLLKFIFRYYGNLRVDKEKISKDIEKFTKENGIIVFEINALQVINPIQGKGVNKEKANGINLINLKAFWLKQLILFTGTWSGFISKSIKISKTKYDNRIYSIIPHKISNEYLSTVYKNLKSVIKPIYSGKDSIKIDIFALQTTTIELIKHNYQFEKEWDFRSPADKISGFQYAYYKQISQFSSAVTNIGFLGLPNFVKFNSESTGITWIKVWEEHRNIISKIREDNSSNISMLQKYRQFISASDFEAFFDFQFEYTSNLISDLNKSNNDNSKQYLIIFNLNNMEVLMQNQMSYQGILNNIGFQAVANAIRNSTIVPIIHKDNKNVMFGLNQKLKIASRNNDNLVTEVSNFIQQYNETMMLKDYHNKPHKKYVTTEELQEFCKILDNGVSSKLIAGMLVAFGYAKEPSQNNSEENKGNNND